MPVEAVPIIFDNFRSVEKAADEIGTALSRGDYVGHVAVHGSPDQFSAPYGRVEGIVLLVDVPDTDSSPKD